MEPTKSTAPDWTKFKDVLKFPDMAKVLGCSIPTLRNRETNGFKLPPTIPGCGKQRVWRKTTVVPWYESLEA